MSLRTVSLSDRLRQSDRERVTAWVASLPVEMRVEVLRKYGWQIHQGREEQLPPLSRWVVWLFMGGRGSGKTRTGSEFIKKRVLQGAKRIAFVSRTAADCRDTMLYSPGGFMNQWDLGGIRFLKTERRIILADFPDVSIKLYYDTEPDLLRGPEHDTIWCDEIAAWMYAEETYDNAHMTLRATDSGLDPAMYVSTTPKPTDFMVKLYKQAVDEEDPDVVLTRSSTKANEKNLAESYLRYVYKRYAGTHIEAQELEGDMVFSMPGALWNLDKINRYRALPHQMRMPVFISVVVGVDPQAGKDRAETGIVTVGLAEDGKIYVLHDDSLKGTPDEWAAAVDRAASRTWRRTDNGTDNPEDDMYLPADLIVAEGNNGGEMVRSTLKNVNPTLPVSIVHGRVSKQARAQPVSARAAVGEVRHWGDELAVLEAQLCQWEPESGAASPDRLDAMVWGCLQLMGGESMAAASAGMRRLDSSKMLVPKTGGTRWT